jgi:hypothetical protein
MRAGLALAVRSKSKAAKISSASACETISAASTVTLSQWRAHATPATRLTARTPRFAPNCVRQFVELHRAPPATSTTTLSVADDAVAVVMTNKRLVIVSTITTLLILSS